MEQSSTDTRLGRIEEAIGNLKEERRDARQEQRDTNEKILARLDAMQQTLQSTGAQVATLAVERCGERLDAHDVRFSDQDRRIAAVETAAAGLPDLLFWKKVLGGGAGAVWRIVLTLLGAGAAGGVISRLIH